MIKMYRKHHIYVDKSVLQDKNSLLLFEELAEKHRSIYLFLHDIWEEEEVKQLEQYEYICDVVYGSDMQCAVNSYRIKRGQRAKQVVLLHGDKNLTTGILDVECMIYDDKVDVERFLIEKNKKIKHKRNIILSILVLCVLYFVGYFLLLNHMPLFMVEGVFAFLLVLLPVEVFIVALFYGFYCGAIQWSFLWELLDMV